MRDIPYDFICLCCGGRNGEDVANCSFSKYVPAQDEDSTSDEFMKKVANWLSSGDYKGSLIVSEGYILPDEYRIRIVRATEEYRKSFYGIILFGLPGSDLSNNVINLSRFFN